MYLLITRNPRSVTVDPHPYLTGKMDEYIQLYFRRIKADQYSELACRPGAHTIFQTIEEVSAQFRGQNILPQSIYLLHSPLDVPDFIQAVMNGRFHQSIDYAEEWGNDGFLSPRIENPLFSLAPQSEELVPKREGRTDSEYIRYLEQELIRYQKIISGIKGLLN